MRVIISSIITSVSLGIYQAYFPLTASLLVLSLIGDCLRGDERFTIVLRRAFYYLVSLAFGMVCYFIMLKLSLHIVNSQLSSYKGINNMGHFPFRDLPFLLKTIRVAFLGLLTNNYFGLAPIRTINMVYRVLGVICIASIGLILYKKRSNPLIIVLTLLFCIILPYAVGLIRIMCPYTYFENVFTEDDEIYTHMVYSYAVVGLAPTVIVEALPKASRKVFRAINFVLRKGSAVFLAILIFLYAYCDEANYTASYYITKQMENYTTALVTQVRMTEGFDTEKQWVFINYRFDPLLNNPWKTAPFYNLNFHYLHNRYSRLDWIGAYFAYDPPIATDEEVDAILARKDIHGELADMPVFPDYGSIKVIENMVVIKMGEID